MLLDSNDLFEVNLAVFENKGTIPFDLYIKISDRYIKIVESNNPIFTSFWEKTKEKKVSKVYVKKSDRMEFIRLGLDSSCNKESN
jgi:hypothetical protein